MERLNQVSFLSARTFLYLVIVGLSLWLGYANASAHLGESIWQDEAATISFHVSRGIVDPFLHYLSPNSHIGFTSMLAAWLKLFPDGVDIPDLRLLPLMLFLAAIPATFAAAFRLGGPGCAIVSTLLFAISPISENFATQLRGYGPSWLFVSLGLLCALSAVESRRPAWWLLGYMASSWAAAAILPTNFLFMAVISVAASVRLMRLSDRPAAKQRETIIILLAVPVLGLLVAYFAIFRELIGFSTVAFSSWTRRDLVADWMHGALSGYVWLAPLAGAGIVSVWTSGVRPASPSGTDGLTSVVLLLGMLGIVLAMPNPPFPRTLVPFLPVWIAASSSLMLLGIRALARPGRSPAILATLLVAVGLVWSGTSDKPCRGERGSGGKFDYDLCYQYFRDNYHPEQVMDTWAEQSRPDMPIVSDYEGFHALRILGAPVRVFEYRQVPVGADLGALFVAHDDTEFHQMAKHVGENPATYHLIRDTGYFKVYGPLNAR